MNSGSPSVCPPDSKLFIEYPVLTEQPPPFMGPAHAISVAIRTTRTLYSPLPNEGLQPTSPLSRIPLYDRVLFSDDVQLYITCCPNHAYEHTLPYDSSTATPRPSSEHRPTILAEIETPSRLPPLISANASASYAMVFPSRSSLNIVFSIVRAVCPCCPSHSHDLNLPYRQHAKYGQPNLIEPPEPYVQPQPHPSYHPPTVFYPPAPTYHTDTVSQSASRLSLDDHSRALLASLRHKTPPADTTATDASSLASTTPSNVRPSTHVSGIILPDVHDHAQIETRPSTGHASSSGLQSQDDSIAPSDSLSARPQPRPSSSEPHVPDEHHTPHILSTSYSVILASSPPKSTTSTVEIPPRKRSKMPSAQATRKRSPPLITYEESYVVLSLSLLIARAYKIDHSNHTEIYNLVKKYIYDKPDNAVIKLSLHGITADFAALRSHLHEFHAAQFAHPNPPTKVVPSSCITRGCLFFPREFGNSDLTIIQPGFRPTKSMLHVMNAMSKIDVFKDALVTITIDPILIDRKSKDFDLSLYKVQRKSSPLTDQKSVSSTKSMNPLLD